MLKELAQAEERKDGAIEEPEGLDDPALTPKQQTPDEENPEPTPGQDAPEPTPGQDADAAAP